MNYNLEEFLDNHMEKNVMEVFIYNTDGSIHNDVNYKLYLVKKVEYKNNNCYIIVEKQK